VKSHYAYLQEGGEFGVARCGWTADYADAENFLALNVSGNKTFNYAHWKNDRYDELMKKSYDERDPARRSALMHEAEKILLAEEPVTSLMIYGSPWLVSSKVKGWHDNAVNDHLSRFLSKE
jgi:oligopeptide transport system substrate-binding protein